MLDEVGQRFRQPVVNHSTSSPSTVPPQSKLFTVCNRHGRRPPLVLLPGLYGLPFPIWSLPSILGKDQPVYLAHALIPEEFGSRREPSIEAMAAAFCAEFKRIYPGKRVAVGGYSFGVLPAFELACRLPAQGVEVPLLISLDGGAPGYPRFLHGMPRLRAHWNELAHGDWRQYLADRAANTRRRLYRLLGREYELTIDARSASADERKAYKLAFDTNITALKRYRPNYKCEADLLLLRAERGERWVGIESVDDHLGGGKFIGGETEVVTLPGSHGTITQSVNHARIATEISNQLLATFAVSTSLPAGEA